MQRARNVIVILVVVLVGIFIFLEASTTTPIDWSPSYWKNHKKPFGAKVFHEIFTQNLGAKELDRTIYEELTENEMSGNILFFNAFVGIEAIDSDELLSWVSDGNTVFISAEYTSAKILDTLELKKEQFDFKNEFAYKPALKFDTASTSKAFQYNRKQNIQYFKNTDTLEHKVLGYAYVANSDSTQIKHLPNFVKAQFGEGQVFLHLFPKVFTNYFLLDGNNYAYTESILNQLDFEKELYVDQFYKSQKMFVQTSILQYLLTNKYLKWAYYIIILMTIIYIFFEGKRKQKSIAIVKPYVNKTYEFTQTIAEMYYSKSDHKSIATKQIEHFFDHVRDVYRIPTSTINDDFVHQLASKSGKEIKQIKTLLRIIQDIENKKQIEKGELIKLDQLIHNIKS